MRIAICTNFISPYRRPVFRAIAEQTGADLRIFVSTDMEADRDWSQVSDTAEPFTVVRVPGIKRTWTRTTPGETPFTLHLERPIPVALPIELARFNPDAIVSGELGPRTLAAMAYGIPTGTPVIPWAYPSEAQTVRSRSTAAIQKCILKNAPRVIGMGRQARAALRTLGAHDSKIIDAPNAADVATIDDRRATPEHAAAVQRIKNEQAGRKIAVIAGRLVPMKGIDHIIEAWNALDPSLKRAWRLVFIGDGPLRERIEQEHGPDAPSVVGHVDPTEIPDWLAAADLHIFASLGDPWGLVVNEAAHCGTPTLCSDLAGCCDDLIHHGSNGLRFSPNAGVHATTQALAESLTHPDLTALGAQAQRDIAQYTPNTMAAAITTAITTMITTTINKSHPRHGTASRRASA